MAKSRNRLRYRMLETALWGQPSFRSLSDKGKLLYFFLRTGPQTTLVPGIFAIGRRAIAERLKWSLKKFRQAFEELERCDMVEADWEAGVVFVADVLQVDPPDNQSVIAGWRTHWSEIPDCSLKTKAGRFFLSHCTERGTAFLEAFIRATGVTNQPDSRQNGDHGAIHGGEDGVPDGSPDRPPHQEQEQEPDQDEDQDIAPSALNVDRVSRNDLDRQHVSGGQGKPGATYRETVGVIQRLYASKNYCYPTGQVDLKEDTKRELARLGRSYDGDTLRKALDAGEFIEQRGLRRR